MGLEQKDEQMMRILVARDLSVDELWDIYGESCGEAATGIDRIQAAKDCFERRKNQILDYVCNSTEIQTLVSDPIASKSVDAAILVARVLSAQNSFFFDIVTLSVLIIRLKILDSCEKWKKR